MFQSESFGIEYTSPAAVVKVAVPVRVSTAVTVANTPTALADAL
jgi:hypothetical protein